MSLLGTWRRMRGTGFFLRHARTTTKYGVKWNRCYATDRMILPPSVSRDPERLRRFEREARLLATLNHPNIAAIYGFEQSHGTAALVLEMVETLTATRSRPTASFMEAVS
jgi:serine/threonine protein kinase